MLLTQHFLGWQKYGGRAIAPCSYGHGYSTVTTTLIWISNPADQQNTCRVIVIRKMVAKNEWSYFRALSDPLSA